IKFIGTGETLDGLEDFHPDRMASRILGMGDLATLIESAQEKFDRQELEEQERRLKEGVFTLEDFRKQMTQLKRLGSFGKLMSFIPGMSQISRLMGSADIDADDQLRKIGGLIDSMTPQERNNPSIIDPRRRQRIAAGAGVTPNKVTELLKMFQPMAEMMKKMGTLGGADRMRAMQELTRQVQQNPFGAGLPQKKGTGKRLTPKEREANRKRLERERRKKQRK
ncbi:MAG: signal recognition particle protein, partial [Thermoguttaceae bacterium]|nr:signal recognition particle protein [Thermoguttaceae bacterium]